MDWAGFEEAAPEIAAAGRRLLAFGGGAPIGFLASAGTRDLHLAPVCPIFAERNVYLSVVSGSPKQRDLERDGRYALHAFLGASDEEFRVTGHASLVTDLAERDRVHAAIAFATYSGADPIYRLTIVGALWGYWERAGQPGTRPVRRTWRAPRPS